MSHLVSLKTKVQDPVAIAAACQRMSVAQPIYDTARLFRPMATTFSTPRER